MSQFEEALELSSKIEADTKEYRKKIGEVLDKIKAWTWDDPVSLVYRELFKPEVILDIKLDDDLEKQIEQDLNSRQTHSIPPGYKDGAKPDQGIGDLLIWKTILELGSKHSKSVIFVSIDWWYQSEKQALYPRYELVEEFRRKSQQQSFHIITLSNFLELYGVSQAVVEEVRREEQVHSVQIVHGMNIPLYSDGKCQQLREGVSGILLESRKMPEDTVAGYQIFPTTRTHFKIGMRAAWEWNLNQVWGETWYLDPTTKEIQFAWSSAGEFVGQSLD